MDREPVQIPTLELSPVLAASRTDHRVAPKDSAEDRSADSD
jgi:hypothetical protein